MTMECCSHTHACHSHTQRALNADDAEEECMVAGMDEVPDWLLFDQQDVHDTLVATSKHKPHLIADMAAMANVPGLANGQARLPVVMHTQQHASQVTPQTLLLFSIDISMLATHTELCCLQLFKCANLAKGRLAQQPCCDVHLAMFLLGGLWKIPLAILSGSPTLVWF